MRKIEQPLPKKIGDYLIEKSLGQGGMGDVFLAFDPICKRQIALKQIRKELSQNLSIQKRFTREALIAAHLSHPSIIPIYSIQKQEDQVFYTMPYVEGETLKQIIKTTQEEEREGEVKHPIGTSIPTLANIFLKVCQAIAYAHSKNILHRDLKPDNIIVGKYGEVLLFDWGLADFINGEEIVIAEEFSASSELTKPGKVPGTLLYLAPERILGQASSIQTDIYALGVILYQILTLHVPFQRKSVQQVRKTLHLEKMIDPLEIAPYRDIPDHLADIMKRCLCFKPEDRFETVDEIILELNSYIEGRPEWIPAAQLDIHRKTDWEFQENVLLAKHIAITRSPDVLEWVSLMISKTSFTGNLRLETRVKLSENSLGIGILLAIPEASERKGLLEEGYYLWIGGENEKGLRIFQFNVEVMTIPDICLKSHNWHQLRVELIDNHLYVYLDQTLCCHYISHLPMVGTHVGVLYRDADFEIEELQVALGSQNAMINCLAIPDTFLANKNYTKALIEYRRIASSFSGRTEGRTALFRAGITLLQQALCQRNANEKELLYSAAQDEFSKLRFTPGAPMEFLGKSLIYKAMHDTEEEEKCLELCLRKYPKHPLIKVISEHITFRLHETSHKDRVAAFHFLLLAIAHLPGIFSIQDNARLFNSLKSHLEPLPFLIPLSSDASSGEERLYVALQIAFWLSKPIPLTEIITCAPLSSFIRSNAILCLLSLQREDLLDVKLCPEADKLKFALSAKEKGTLPALEKLIKAEITPFSLRCIYYLIDREILLKKGMTLLPFFERLLPRIAKEDRLTFDVLYIRLCLLNKKWKKAQEILEGYPAEVLADEYSPLYPLMGCWLRHSEGAHIALSHFSLSIDLPHPPTSMLLSFFLLGKISLKKGWISSAFAWEKIQLFRELHLYYHCANDAKKAKLYLNHLKKELRRVQSQYPHP